MENIKDDMRFKRKCGEYGLSWERFHIFGDVVAVPAPKENILVLFDENYNTIGIFNRNNDVRKASLDVILKSYKEVYESAHYKLPFPFQDYSVKQLVELANRVSTHEINHGNSMEIFVNGERIVDGSDSSYTQLLAYAKFLGEQIEEYYKKAYQMNMMGFEYPDLYVYLSSLVYNIEECISAYILKGERPFPIDIIEYLGQDRSALDLCNHELYQIIDLLLKQRGFMINSGGTTLGIVAINGLDLSNDAWRLLKLLNVPYDPDSIGVPGNTEINLSSWLRGRRTSALQNRKPE